MAHLCNLGLLLISAGILFFQFTICTGVFLGGSCTMNTSCIANVSNSECKNKTCLCATTFYQDNNTCQSKKALEHPCKADVECSDHNAICRTNCTCKPSHYEDKNKICQQQVSLGGSCAMNASCIANVSNSECKNTTCQCAPKYYQDNNTCQSKKALEHPCKADVACSDINAVCHTNCTCKPSYYKDNKAVCQQRVPLGGPCVMNSNCIANVSNSECKKKTCQCAATFYQENKRCHSKKALENPCKADVECSDDNAICRTNCTCKPSHYKDNNTVCQQRIHPNMTCGSSAPGDASCVANAFCNQTHFCVCRIGYKTTKTSCNSAMTIAKLEISTMIMCFFLACLGVLT